MPLCTVLIYRVCVRVPLPVCEPVCVVCVLCVPVCVLQEGVQELSLSERGARHQRRERGLWKSVGREDTLLSRRRHFDSQIQRRTRFTKVRSTHNTVIFSELKNVNCRSKPANSFCTYSPIVLRVIHIAW